MGGALRVLISRQVYFTLLNRSSEIAYATYQTKSITSSNLKKHSKKKHNLIDFPISNFYFSCLLLEHFGQNKDFNQLCFNYLMFLIEIVNVPTSAFVEVVSIMNEEMSLSSLKEQMIFSSIFYRA